jgi:hypothetical protein
MQFLYKPIKIGLCMKFVQTYEAQQICDVGHC